MRRGLLARLDTPAACLLVLMVALSIFTVGKLSRSGFDPSAFIVAGDRFSNAKEVPRGVAVLVDSAGYDGQFYYRLALDPFTSAVSASGITLDNPAYRHQRFLYPFIVHLVSLRDARLVPVAMIATNFAFYCWLAWIAGSLAQTFGRHALWGLLIVVNPGFLISYSRDLVEIVEAGFLLGSVLSIRRGEPARATVFLTLAVLTRETSLIVAVAAALVFVSDRLRGHAGSRAAGRVTSRVGSRFPWWYFVVPIASFCCLQLCLWLNWGQVPLRAGNPVLGTTPLTGFGSSLSATSAPSPGIQLSLAFVVLCTMGILYHLRSTKAGSWEILACLLYGVLLGSVGATVWIEDVAFLRVFTHFYVFGALVVFASPLDAVGVCLSVVAVATWASQFVRLGAPAGLVQLLHGHPGVG